LIDLGPFGPWVLAFAVATWLFLSVWLLGGRALHELRHMGVRIRGHRLVPRGPEQSPEMHAERARGLIARLPAKVIERLAADAGMPQWLSGPFAVHTVAQRGLTQWRLLTIWTVALPTAMATTLSHEGAQSPAAANGIREMEPEVFFRSCS
jgi:hypothetical protein